MVKKKVAKKTSRKKVSRPAKKSVQRKVSRTTNSHGISQQQVRSRLPIVVKNLILFAILFVASLVVYLAAGTEGTQNMFFLSSILFGFITLALIIALLVFLILRGTRR